LLLIIYHVTVHLGASSTNAQWSEAEKATKEN